MFRFFKEIYLTCFTLFYRFACKRWSHGSNVGKGLGGVVLIESICLIVIASWIEIYSGARFLLTQGKMTVWAVILIIAVPNFYALVVRDHGIKFEREFSHLEKGRRLRLVLNCAAVLLILLAFAIYSVYTYQHFFHISAQR